MLEGRGSRSEARGCRVDSEQIASFRAKSDLHRCGSRAGSAPNLLGRALKRADFSPFAFAHRKAKDAGPETATATVLVCEDDKQLRVLVDFMLGDAGYDVLLASSGEE